MFWLVFWHTLPEHIWRQEIDESKAVYGIVWQCSVVKMALSFSIANHENGTVWSASSTIHRLGRC